METQWRCKRCRTLLGTGRGMRLYLRYKEMQYILDGSDYTVVAVCRNCSTVNECSGTSDALQSQDANR